jgi:hypothetical protein
MDDFTRDYIVKISNTSALIRQEGVLFILSWYLESNVAPPLNGSSGSKLENWEMTKTK